MLQIRHRGVSGQLSVRPFQVVRWSDASCLWMLGSEASETDLLGVSPWVGGVCVCVCRGWVMYSCTCVWRLRDTLRWCSLEAVHLGFFLRQCLSQAQDSLSRLGWQATEPQWFIYLSPMLEFQVYAVELGHVIASQAVYQLKHLPCPLWLDINTRVVCV